MPRDVPTDCTGRDSHRAVHRAWRAWVTSIPSRCNSPGNRARPPSWRPSTQGELEPIVGQQHLDAALATERLEGRPCGFVAGADDLRAAVRDDHLRYARRTTPVELDPHRGVPDPPTRALFAANERAQDSGAIADVGANSLQCLAPAPDRQDVGSVEYRGSSGRDPEPDGRRARRVHDRGGFEAHPRG